MLWRLSEALQETSSFAGGKKKPLLFLLEKTKQRLEIEIGGNTLTD